MFRLVAGLLACLSAGPSIGQEPYPNRTVTLVVPFAAGSATDIFARIIGNELKNKVGQPVVIDNKPGANGAVAAEYVKRAKPDGYTILMGTTGTASNVWLMKEQRVDPTRDFEPVSRFRLRHSSCAKLGAMGCAGSRRRSRRSCAVMARSEQRGWCSRSSNREAKGLRSGRAQDC